MNEYDHAIAVIGFAGRFPGADSVAELWTRLCAGESGLTRFDPAELLAARVPAADVTDPAYVPVRGVVDGIEDFDADLFGMSPREAELTDPQHRVLLEVARTALEHAGYAPEHCADRVGVFVGSGASSYLAGNLVGLAAEDGDLALALGNDPAFLATRLAHRLNLRGPALTVQTACSTSLVAVHLAGQSLLSGESGIALAGGVSVEVPQTGGHRHTPNGIVSSDGRCRSFDAAADGTVRGNGAAIVVLKHAEAALADGDTIYALIRGSAVNNDGAVKIGFTAPSVTGQAEVIALAHEVAGVGADDIAYVEAHATATPLGDPIEVAALTEAFRRGTDRVGYCALGALKPNIGHLDYAAGVAGLLKAVLALHHESIPPTIDFERPNPKIDFAGSPFFVNTELRSWPRVPGTPRRCGVSAFGFGGTNAHVVLEEAPFRPSTSDRPGHPVLLPLSARTADALGKLITATGDELATTELAPADVAHTLQTGRTAFVHRAAVAVDDFGAVTAPLLASARVARDVHDVVFLFPGQGTFRPGMLRELYDRCRTVRDTVDECSDLLGRDADVDLRAVLCGDADSATIRQPAMFTAGLALSALVRGFGIEPSALLGHSLGEYVAATVAGAWTVADAMAVVVRRGAAMAGMPPGAMLAVAASPEELDRRLPDGVWISGVHGPGSLTVAGAPDAIARCRAALLADGVHVTRVAVDRAFHTPHVECALPELRAAVGAVEHRPLTTPLIANHTGGSIPVGALLSTQHWAHHAREPVRLDAAMSTALARPGVAFFELGGRSGLVDAVRLNAGGTRTEAFALGGQTADPILRERDVLAALARFWAAGGTLDWTALPASSRRRVPLPTYPYDRRRHWVDAADRVVPVDAMPDSTAGPVDATADRVRGIWTELLGHAAFAPGVNFLELGGSSLTAIQMATRLRREFGVRLSLSALFDSPTIEGIAGLVRARTTR
jgi:phthiocerol/phenolphthiocerol synthesis type-I polyketide synthase E